MESVEKEATIHYVNDIEKFVNPEELVYFLSEQLPEYKVKLNQFLEQDSNVTRSVLQFLTAVPGSFIRLCAALGEDGCCQPFLADYLQTYVKSNKSEEQDGEGIVEPDTSSKYSRESLYTTVVDKVILALLNDNTSPLVIYGPEGSGKSTIIKDCTALLTTEHNFYCYLIDITADCCLPVTLLNIDKQLRNHDKKDSSACRPRGVFIADNCNDENIYHIIKQIITSPRCKMMNITGVICTNKLNIINDFEPEHQIKIDHMTDELSKTLISWMDLTDENCNAIIKHSIHYPLHLILSVSLLKCCDNSVVNFLRYIPKLQSNEFLKDLICAIVSLKSDMLKALAVVSMYRDVGGCDVESVLCLMQSSSRLEVLAQLSELCDLHLIYSIHDRYQMLSIVLECLLSVPTFTKDSVLKLFCSKYLSYAATFINNLDKPMRREGEEELWNYNHYFVLKSLITPLPVKSHLWKHRCYIIEQLSVLWQTRFLALEECIFVYEVINEAYLNNQHDNVTLEQQFSIYVSYISSFFHRPQFALVHKDLVTELISKALVIHRRIENGKKITDIYCELLNHIIELKIQTGDLDTVDDDLSRLINIQKELRLPESVVTHTKVKRAKMMILKDRCEEARDILESSQSGSQLGRSHMSNIKCKITMGDKFYMENDIQRASLKYKMAFVELGSVSDKTMLDKQQVIQMEQYIQCKISHTDIQNPTYGRKEFEEALKGYKKCQEVRLANRGSKYSMYCIYIAATYLLLQSVEQALAELLEFRKLWPNERVFISITSEEKQMELKDNVAERLEGPELTHIDNYVNQWRVNYLYLCKANYQWVMSKFKSEVVEERYVDIIDVQGEDIRRSVLNFPTNMLLHNKRLLVVFEMTEASKTGRRRTLSALSEVSSVGSSFISDMIALNPEQDVMSEQGLEEDQPGILSNVMKSVYDDACSLIKFVTFDVSKRFMRRVAPDVASNLTAALINSLTH